MKLLSCRFAFATCVISALALLAVTEASPGQVTTGTLGTPAPETNEQSQEVKDAIELFKQRNLQGALDKLKEAAQKDQDLPPAQIMMAELCAQARQGFLVRLYLEQAVFENPKDPEPYLIFGEMALPDRRVTEADLLFNKAAANIAGVTSATRKKRLQPRIEAGLASVAEARRDWPTAQKHLEAWLALDTENAVAMQRLARALFKQDKVVEARDQLKAAYEANPKILNWAATLASFYQEAGDQEMAKKWMEYALTVAPNDLRTLLVAAQWALQVGDIEAAQKYAAKATDVDAKSLDAQILRGVVALFEKDYPKAEIYFEAAVLQSPSNFGASNNLALALIEQDDQAKKRRALEYAAENARLNPKSVEALSTYGWVLYNMGRVNDAERVLLSLLRSGNLDNDTLYYISRVLVDRGRKEDAKILLDRALKNKRPFSKRQEATRLMEQVSA